MPPKNFIPVYNPLNRILQTLQSEEQKSYQYYQSLLNKHLPPKWKNHVIIGKIEGLRWYLWVRDNTHAYQLRFLLTEIEALLNTELPRTPQLKVSARPDIAEFFTEPPRMPHYRTRYFSEKEAEKFLQSFLENNTATKPCNGTSDNNRQ